jgi:hypothetical protein
MPNMMTIVPEQVKGIRKVFFHCAGKWGQRTISNSQLIGEAREPTQNI